ncbi:unnamed protein product [Meganyctiphanes norvegica]|uniref:Cuticle protein n=1 Tax=Meganyctiphanes norvegica TaxID=48144 RepID=A0AAV2R3W8_MEGNR
MLLVCLSGLCLSCSAAPFDPVATANNWVGSLSAQYVPLNQILQSPVAKPLVYVNPAAVAMPVVKAATPVVKSRISGIHPVAVAIPVLKAAAVAVSSPVIVAEAPEPLDAPNPPMPSLNAPYVGGQFHAQDEMGQYAFGHHGGSNTRVETRDYLGRVTGSFSYINPDNDVHVRKYAAAPGMGFKVAGSDIPVDTPEVASVKAAHAELIAAVKSASSS